MMTRLSKLFTVIPAKAGIQSALSGVPIHRK
jgi:hypothetical protein